MRCINYMYGILILKYINIYVLRIINTRTYYTFRVKYVVFFLLMCV